MSSDEIIFDAALLEEVVAFFKTSDSFLPQTPPVNSSTAVDALEIASSRSPESPTTDCYSYDVNDSKYTKDNVAALKRKTRREKEAIRKQRYQRRLKHERETLRRMEKMLSIRLQQLKLTHKSRACAIDGKQIPVSSDLQDVGRREQEARLRAEEEQKRLVEAITIQTSYLATLQDLLPYHANIYSVAACKAPKCETNKQIAHIPGDFDFSV